MVFTNITPFPTTLTPLTNISPLTYRDAATFLEYLETIKQWLNETLVPETDTLLENAVAEFQTGIANAEATVTEAKDGWDGEWNEWTTEKAAEYLAFSTAINTAFDTFKNSVNASLAATEADITAEKTAWQQSFDAFMANVEAELEALNDAALSNLINDPLSNTTAALKAGYVPKGTIVANIKDFGAKGDGVTDDSVAFETAFATVKGAVFMPEGDYLITKTLYLDVEKTSLIGFGGKTRIVVSPVSKSFTGTVVLQVFSGSYQWSERQTRIRTVGGFHIINLDVSYTLTALSMSGPRNTDYEGHVETVRYHEMFIDGFNIAQAYSSHVYKTVTDRLWTKRCNYAVMSSADQTDAGEVPVWSNCMFADDSGRFIFKTGAYFLNCSFHLFAKNSAGTEFTHAFRVENSANVMISGCHFEDISTNNGTVFYNPWFYIDGAAALTIRDSFGVVSGTAWSYFKWCVIENAGNLYLNSPGFQDLYLRVKYDDAYNKATRQKPGCFVDNGTTGRSVVRGMNSKPIFSTQQLRYIESKSVVSDSTFAVMNATQLTRTLKKMVSDPATIDDLSNINTHTLAFTIETTDPLAAYGPKSARVASSLGAEAGGAFFRLGVLLPIPAGATVAGLATRFWKTGGNYVGMQNSMYMFFDSFGSRIPQSEVLALNNGINLGYNVTADNTVLEMDNYNTYRRIPNSAAYVFMSLECQQPGNSTMNINFDYFNPQFV